MPVVKINDIRKLEYPVPAFYRAGSGRAAVSKAHGLA